MPDEKTPETPSVRDRMAGPPPGTWICGADSWDALTIEARTELWEFYDRLKARPSRKEALPRRIQLNRLTPAELAILTAVQEVEDVGADPLLTDAVVLLEQAREKVADYVDRSTAATEPEQQ